MKQSSLLSFFRDPKTENLARKRDQLEQSSQSQNQQVKSNAFVQSNTNSKESQQESQQSKTIANDDEEQIFIPKSIKKKKVLSFDDEDMDEIQGQCISSVDKGSANHQSLIEKSTDKQINNNKKKQISNKNKMEIENDNDDYKEQNEELSEENSFIDEDSFDTTKKATNKRQSAKSTINKSNKNSANNKEQNMKSITLKPKNSGDKSELINCDQENNIARSELEDLREKTPIWATKEHLKDQNGKRYGEEGYDPSTIYIPESEFKKLQPGMKQYWQIKKNNFDKIIFFKLGKFYELFFEDALISNQILDLNWMGNKMHTGFPEKCLEKYATKLVELGYKVGIVEQVETPKQMNERVQSGQGKKEKVVNRELVQIYTKGTSGFQDIGYEPHFLMIIRQFQTNFGICILETSTNKITLSYIEDNDKFTMFKMLLCQVKPVEVLYDQDNIRYDIVKILKSGYLKPVLSTLNNKQNKWHKGVAYNYIEQVYGDISLGKWPNALQYFTTNTEQRELVFSALAGGLEYLKSLLIMEDILTTARFQVYDQQVGVRNCMILDSQTLQHLEILEVLSGLKSEQDYSLFGYIDRTYSPFGKRLLKQWICAPLMNIQKINERLDAIECLNKLSQERKEFQNGLKKLPDLERICSRIYKYSVQTNAKQKAILYEDISGQRLKEYKDLLKNLILGEQLIRRNFSSYGDQIKSERLRQLVLYEEEFNNGNINNNEDQANIDQEENDQNDGLIQEQPIYNNDEKQNFIYQDSKNDTQCLRKGLLPHIKELIEQFDSLVYWEKKSNSKDEIPVPSQGIIESFDIARNNVKKCKDKLYEYLDIIRQQFQDKSIDYVDAKYRFELEIPEKHVKGTKKPKYFEFTSQKQGFQRFHTNEIKDLLSNLEDAEQIEKEEMSKFVCFVFKQFQLKYKTWDALISILSELDCLCSLSQVSFLNDGPMCRPQLSYAMDESEVFMDIKDARHPCVGLTGVQFIPNDITIGNVQNRSEFQTLMLLTGPNMGGKSTVLRMTCIISIIAQLGCYVPAKVCKMSVVDRIFTRLGAQDKLIEGKSTFFIEMEETSNAVLNGTHNSLIIMDELGRGTSTFDGVAIAYSILKFLVEQLKCRCLFATHYHILLDEFRNHKKIACFHMASVIDSQKDKILFLYKLKPGECQNSFGINVAKVVGINESIIECAKKKAHQFEQDLNIRKLCVVNKVYTDILSKLFFQQNQHQQEEVLQDKEQDIKFNLTINTPVK